jgi:hypothetical protein
MFGHHVVGDPEEPTGEGPRVLVPERGQSLPGGQKDVLGGVLSILGPAQASVGVTEDPLPVSVEQLSERIDVAAPRTLDQMLEVVRAGLLLPLYRWSRSFPCALS